MPPAQLTTQSIAETIQLIIAPVVMISACSIFVNGLVTRYGAVNDRMRLMARERLELCLSNSIQSVLTLTPFARERLRQIDHQLPRLLVRHRQLHDSITLLYSAVSLFVADMFVIAATAATEQVWLSAVVLIVFLISTFVFFVGVLLAVFEIHASHQTVAYEVTQVNALDIPMG